MTSPQRTASSSPSAALSDNGSAIGDPVAVHRDDAPAPASAARDQAAELQRSALLIAMIGAVGESGYTDVSVADVLKRSGVSRKAFYRHFANKRECFLAAFEAVAAEGRRRVSAACQTSTGWPDRARAAIAAFLQAAADNPDAVRLGMLDISAVGAPGIERREESVVHYERLIGDGLALAPGAGEALPLGAKAVVGGINRIVCTRARRGRTSELVDLADDLVTWASAYYPAPESILAEHRRRVIDRSTPARAPMGGRAPGTLSPPALPNARRGLPRGDQNISRSFVIHSQRERILDAVTTLSAAEGFASLRVEDVAARAAVSLEAFYRHFDSKQDAFLVAYELGHTKALAIVQRAFEGQSDWRLGIREGVRALAHLLAGEPAFAYLALVEVPIAMPLSADRFDAGVDAYRRLLMPGVEEASREDPPPSLAAEAVVGAIAEILFHEVVQGRTAELQRLAAELTYIALAPFLGPEQAAAIAIEPSADS